MKLNHIKTVAVAGASALMLGHAEAQSQFTFAFTGQPLGSRYSTGTVTGLITLNASQTEATSFVLTSVPSDITPADPLSLEFVQPGFIYVNSFTVVGGHITSMAFGAYDTPNGIDSIAYIGLSDPSISLGDMYQTPSGLVFNTGGFSSITFTPVPVPEPSTLALAALGAGALLKFRRRK